MLIAAIEQNATTALLSLVEDINNQHAVAWSVVEIKRPHLKNLTNDEMVFALKPALQEVAKAKIFFMENETIYVTWFGIPRQTYQKLTCICQSLMRPNVMENVDDVITYFDPYTMGEELQALLNRQARKQGIVDMALGEKRRGMALESNGDDWFGYIELLPTVIQADQFRKLVGLRPARQQLEILIVEDQTFLRNLLSEVLRADFKIYAASNLKEGWALFLEKAPDIVFLDIQLPDGSGHALAHAIKEHDPSSYIVMVTASNRRDDVGLAKQNHVDGFIVKPFNKKKVFDCVDHYRTSRNGSAKKRDQI